MRVSMHRQFISSFILIYINSYSIIILCITLNQIKSIRYLANKGTIQE